jgi:hypothetical protein
MKSFDEISAEAFRNLLRKYGQPENLRAVLKESARATHQASVRTYSGRAKSKKKR